MKDREIDAWKRKFEMYEENEKVYAEFKKLKFEAKPKKEKKKTPGHLQDSWERS